jgi:hypothetical protein
MTVPMPATWAPDRVIVSICQAADPLRPPDWYGFQLPPVADVPQGHVLLTGLAEQARGGETGRVRGQGGEAR